MNGSDEKTVQEELAADGSFSGVEEELYTPYPFDAEKISIRPRIISLSNVMTRMRRGLIQAAEMQRRENLWDIGKKSRLIESLMLKIPLPLFYAAETKDDQLVIVDGLQRLSAIRGYVLEKKYNLKSLEFMRELEGKAFDDIPDQMQIRINETELNFAVIGPDSPPEVQRNIFKRLNTGGLPLTDQEIRHALYFGPATDLLKKLVDSKEFAHATDERVNDSRMAAQELVLRFLAFSIMGIEEYRKDDEMDSYLSDAMRIINDIKSSKSRKFEEPSYERAIHNKDLDAIERNFILAMERAFVLFVNCAFRITTPAKYRMPNAIRTPINKSLFEAWSVLLANMPHHEFEKLKKNSELLYAKIDTEFDSRSSVLRNYIGKDSSKVVGVRGRYQLIRKIINSTLEEGE